MEYGTRTRPDSPLWDGCPFCDETVGPRLVVYNHIDDYDGIDPDDVFTDPIGPLRNRQ
jgi:hypothetical protein